MRLSKVTNLRRLDIRFKGTFIKIFVQKSKTDVYSKGNWLCISSFNSACPVQQLRSYLDSSKINENSDEYKFRAISRGPKSKLRIRNVPISYTQLRQNFIQVLKIVGLKWKEYGPHSLRPEGASLAANVGIPHRLFKRHGRWKPDRAKDGYIEDGLKNLLLVSRRLRN